MPTLPTFEITDAQAARLLDAFGSVEAYQDWLKETIVNYVLNHEIQQDTIAFNSAIAAKRASLLALLS